MIVFGIDPGVSGAISVFENKKIVSFFDMPTQIEGTKNKKRQVNAIQLTYEIKSRINDIKKTAAVVEMVNAMPNQGVTSMFNFGQSYGVIKGIFLALEIPTFFVRPAKWKKHFDLLGTEKDASRIKAIEMFPNLYSQLAKKKDSNKSDAILIGKYFVDHYSNEGFHG